MPKSKVKTVTFNREWRHPEGGSVFYFDIELEDGMIAQFSTNKREQDKFPLNQEVNYREKGTNKRGTPMIDIVKDRPEFKSKYNDPRNNMRVAMSVSLSAAIKTAVNLEMQNITEDDIFSIAQFYFQWITEGENDRDLFSLKWNSVLNAVEYMAVNDISTSKAVLESAKEFYKIIESIELPTDEASH